MKLKNVFLGFLLAGATYFLCALNKKTLLPENSLLFGLTTFIYLGSSLIYLIYWIFKWNKGAFLGSSIGWSGFFLNLLAFFVRWVQTHKAGFGYVPLSNLYESLVFFGLCIAGVYLFLEFKLPTKIFGSIVFLVASLIMAYASLKASSEIKPLLPALKSNWLVAHVITCFLGYGAFAVAFAFGVFYLISDKRNLKNYLPSKTTLDNLIYKLILFGFFWLTLGIITGAVWADQAWGSYWSWDPKETWSLITWLIYGGTIHAKLTRGWSGKKLAWLSIIGFASVIFTYFGVNFLLSGLHTYATP
ncbi:MAG: c-type cytochrome biogenesis protein CcsB [Thermodesulfobacterium geofontis]|uniref:Heme exporter protein C n=1 Tax=Thermodesulfobacterium geofontis TaxID=1295609 RepID=A0A2N7PMH8_9BACT|nr:MAG: c-type cytochrome biogenesis protein CcsB [Thermodesulfobacterium geofontis]